MDSPSSAFVKAFIFENLPEDVGRIVFEFVAEESVLQGLRCALVSKKVQSWVEPVIYRSVTLLFSQTSERFYRTLNAPTSTKPPYFFAEHVKTLVVNFTANPEHIIAFLTKCTGIRTLACWLTVSQASSLVWDTMKSLPEGLTQLSIRLDPLPDGAIRDFSFTIFRNLTHLEIVSVNGAEWNWDSLRTLAHLTHFSLDISWNISPQLLKLVNKIIGPSSPPSLRVFVVFYSGTDGTPPEHPPANLDTRVVFATGDDESFVECEGEDVAVKEMVIRCVDDLVTDWAGRPVGTDFWSQAEQIIHRRQQAEHNFCSVTQGI